MTRPGSPPRPLVIGVGNRLRGDDGVGAHVAGLVRDRCGATIDTTIVEGDLSDLALHWRPDQHVVLVDAMVTGRAPGTVLVLDEAAATSADTAGPLSSHGVGLVDAIALAKAIGRPPRSLAIVAIEGQAFEHGTPLSEPVEAAAANAVDRVVDLVRDREVSVDRS